MRPRRATPTPLAGAAVGSGIPLETLLAFASGIALGGVVVWLWYHMRRKHLSQHP